MSVFPQSRLEKISELFHQCLMDSGEGEIAREFLLNERGIDPEQLRDFEIGFCPPNLNYPGGKFDVEGHLWYMRGRLVFTIRSCWGEILGFNGRIVPGASVELWESLNSQFGDMRATDLHQTWSDRKWVNEKYDKSSHVYRLYDVKRDLLQCGAAVLAEGCMDVLALTLSGIPTALSLLGTSISDCQIAKVLRYADHIVVCMDGDTVGEQATKKIHNLNVNGNGQMSKRIDEHFSISTVRLPLGMDPEDALRNPNVRDDFLQALRYEMRKKLDGHITDLTNEQHILGLRMSTEKEHH